MIFYAKLFWNFFRLGASISSSLQREKENEKADEIKQTYLTPSFVSAWDWPPFSVAGSSKRNRFRAGWCVWPQFRPSATFPTGEIFFDVICRFANWLSALGDQLSNYLQSFIIRRRWFDDIWFTWIHVEMLKKQTSCFVCTPKTVKLKCVNDLRFFFHFLQSTRCLFSVAQKMWKIDWRKNVSTPGCY